MEQIPKLVIDLAYILIVAGVVTIIFKRLRQPLVLGYIIAGFLAGPNMPYTPSVADIDSSKDGSFAYFCCNMCDALYDKCR